MATFKMCFLMSRFEILQMKNYRPDIFLILKFDILKYFMSKDTTADYFNEL